MRRVAGLLSVFCVLCPSLVAHAEVTATNAGISQPIGGGKWSGPASSVYYPGGAYFLADLRGDVPGRDYEVRAMVIDAKGRPVVDYSFKGWLRLPADPRARFQYPFTIASARHAPGEWRQTLDIDGVRVVDLKLDARRIGPEPGPPVKLARALLTSSISRNQEPRRPLESLSLSSTAYYYVQATGFQAGRDYQVHIEMLDGAGRRVGDHHFATRARAASHTIWYPVQPRPTDAAGTWTFRIEIDRDPLAETRIEAAAGPARTKSGELERRLPALAALVALGLAGYLAFGLRASRGVTIAAAPPARSIADPALFALVAANLLPLALAYFGLANAADLLFIYWTENFVIALYGIARIAMARGPGSRGAWLAVLGFALLFGMLTLVHSGVLWYFVWDHSNVVQLVPRESFDPLGIPVQFALATLVLFVSHGVSFVQNYLRRGEFLVTTPDDEMKRPLDRVMAMHFAGTLVGVFAAERGSPLLMLIALVAIKTGLDVHAHVRTHARVLRPA